MAGLALLSKVSGLVLLPWAGLFLAAVVLTDPQLRAANGPRWWRSVGWWLTAARRTLLPYLLWLGCLALTMFVVWPAMWVEPWIAVGDMIEEAILNGGQPHAWGNYFLGRSIPDPGPLFYPVAVLWRSSPLMLIGLLALPLAFWRARDRRTTGRQDDGRSTIVESTDVRRRLTLRRRSLIRALGLPGAAGLGAAVWPFGQHWRQEVRPLFAADLAGAGYAGGGWAGGAGRLAAGAGAAWGTLAGNARSTRAWRAGAGVRCCLATT